MEDGFVIRFGLVGLLGSAALLAGGGFMDLQEIEAKVVCCVEETKVSKDSPLAKSAPLVCTLSDGAKRARREEIGDSLLGWAKAVTEIETGYTVEFENGHAREIVEFIELERECCSFFEFGLHFGADNGPTTLTITGPDGVKDFLRRMFDIGTDQES